METIKNAAAKSNSSEAQKLSALVDVINQASKPYYHPLLKNHAVKNLLYSEVRMIA